MILESDRINTIIMVLLPKPPPPKDPATEITRNVFFENDTMDHLAKHFVGNNFRLVQKNIQSNL